MLKGENGVIGNTQKAQGSFAINHGFLIGFFKWERLWSLAKEIRGMFLTVEIRNSEWGWHISLARV